MPPHAALAAAATPEQLCACAAAVMRGGHHAHVGGELVGVAGDADSQRLLKVSQRTICPLSHASRGDSGDGTGYLSSGRGSWNRGRNYYAVKVQSCTLLSRDGAALTRYRLSC